MKKYFLMSLMAFGSMFLMSWGVVGHKTIAQIAENHLTLQAKNAVKSLLVNQSLADVATWADEARNQAEYKKTTSWHYLNIPLGLNFQEFVLAVKSQKNENVYTALIKCEQELANANTTLGQKATALKFMVHFVGDLHQPMHISRAEDKGGNTIQVRYDNKGINLHSLWDSKLIEHQNISYIQLANNYDIATPKEINQWQSDDVLKWIFESYQISSQLYLEIEKNYNIDDQYYSSHLSIIQQRLKKGGIRLAGILNSSLKSFNITQTLAIPANTTSNAIISINEISKHIGEKVTICTKMYGYKVLENMTLVNMGADYPNQLLTVVLKGAVKDEYTTFGSNNICVVGKLIIYKGKPEIIITEHDEIKIF